MGHCISVIVVLDIMWTINTVALREKSRYGKDGILTATKLRYNRIMEPEYTDEDIASEEEVWGTEF